MIQRGERMKWPFIGLVAVFAAAIVGGGIAALCRRRPKIETDDIDGGVVKRYWADVPKVIKSTEIVTFHFEISLFAACKTDGLGHRVYTLDAALKAGEVLVKYDWYDRQGGRDKGEYKADADFMTRLQEIVAAHNFAQHNGYYHTVSGLPEDCCAESAENFGCNHGICPESAAWKNHYCSKGGHCVGKSSKIEHDEDEHWTVCGDGCDIILNSELHTFGESTVTKEATKTTDGVMKFTCSVCGFVKEEAIPKLTDGHTHEYTAVVTKPTCESGGYTTHACECGHTYTDMQTPAVKHNYVHKHTESEHWRECEYCHTTTEKSAHKMGAWTTVLKAGYTFEGEKQSECKICEYTVKEIIPVLGVPDGKLVVVIPDYEKYISTGSVSSSETPSSDISGKTESSGSTTTPSGSEAATPPSSGIQPSGKNYYATKELVTKGTDNTVPALPVLPPTEAGNQFDGWVNKATGEPVKKGDTLTENIEIEPVWKDCGEDKHTDIDEDNRCDKCGYIMVNEVKPEDTAASTDETTEDSGHEDEKAPKYNSGGIPSWFIIVISCFGGVIAICGVVLAVVLRKKK